MGVVLFIHVHGIVSRASPFVCMIVKGLVPETTNMAVAPSTHGQQGQIDTTDSEYKLSKFDFLHELLHIMHMNK